MINVEYTPRKPILSAYTNKTTQVIESSSSINNTDKAGAIQNIIDQAAMESGGAQAYLDKFDHWCFQIRASLNFLEVKRACQEVQPMFKQLSGLNDEMTALYKMKAKAIKKV